MNALLPNVDPDGLLEFSVVFTDRSLNHMSKDFQGVMNDISGILTDVYNAEACALIPGGGTFAMEAVARQFATDQNVMVLRNGWFSYRWSQIFDAGDFAETVTVLKASRTDNAHQSAFAPMPIDDVVAKIRSEKPAVFFAPHVETSSGIILPDDYMKAIADVVHSVGGLFVLDCIASGCIWVDMAAIGIDVVISAPQKGWSASPSAGMVMMAPAAIARMAETESNSFAVNLKTWSNIMNAYTSGGHAYHATMPTDAIKGMRDVMFEMREYGFDKLKALQAEQGQKVRALLAARGFKSVAAAGYAAPGVVVSYTDDADIKNGSKFSAQGVQIAAGVPLQCDEPADYSTFRLGLFGLDKLYDVDATVARLEAVLDTLA